LVETKNQDKQMIRIHHAVLWIGLTASFTLQAEERLPPGLIEVLENTQVGINKICLKDNEFKYSQPGDLTEFRSAKERPFLRDSVHWHWLNDITFKTVRLDLESETLWFEGAITTDIFSEPRSPALLIVGKEVALEKKIVGHTRTLTDDKGLFKLETQVKPEDCLYFCTKEVPVNEFFIHEFLEKLKSSYRILKDEESGVFDLSGNWVVSLPNHKILLVNLEQKGLKLSGKATPKSDIPFTTYILNGTFNGDELEFTLEKSGPMGFNFFGSSGSNKDGRSDYTMIWEGKVNQVTLSGKWKYVEELEGDLETEWVAYREDPVVAVGPATEK
jgi:hypothetical protein